MDASPTLVSLIAWKPLLSGTLRGFAAIRLGRSLRIADISVHSDGSRRWVHLPAKPALDRAGAAQRDEKGKIKFISIISWLDKPTSEWFSAAVVEAVAHDHPGALD